MSAPERIFVEADTFREYLSTGYEETYYHKSLVNELKGYTRHSVGCSAYPADSDKPCDCGLTALLKRMEE